MLVLVLVGCARAVPQPPPPEPPVVVEGPAVVVTESGRYRVWVTRGAPGELVLGVTTAAGEPVTDAQVAVVIDGDAMLVQPGDHAGGRYVTQRPPGWAPKPDASGQVHVAVDAGAGLDRAVLALPEE